MMEQLHVKDLEGHELLYIHSDEPPYRLERRTRNQLIYRNEWGIKYVYEPRNWKSKVVEFESGFMVTCLVLDFEATRRKPVNRFKIFKRDGYRCQICGRTAKDDCVKLEVDHKYPVSKGGDNSTENLWTLCMQCNREKSDSLL